MFNKAAFVSWWTAQNLGGIVLKNLSVDQAKVSVEAFKKSNHWVFSNGLLLGETTAHLTLTPDKSNESFEYFHLTLDRPEVEFKKDGGKKGKGETVRCDHVFFETDEIGDVKVTTNLYDADGKNTNASSKQGLTHNEAFLAKKVIDDINLIMGTAAFVLMPQNWH